MRKIRNNLNTLFNSSTHTKGLYLTGDAGNSKSYNIYKYLKEEDINFNLLTARVTNLSLYLTMHKYKNKTIVFDDVYFEKGLALDLLKGALAKEGKVCWLSTSSKLPEGVPSSFKFTGKIIIITNEGVKDTKRFYPLLSRVFVCEHDLTFKQYCDVAKIMCDERKIVFKELKDYLNVFQKHYDLRNIRKAIDYIEAGHKDMVYKLFEVNEELVYLDKLLKKNNNVSNKSIQNKWSEKFFKSRKTYFRRLKEYRKLTS